MSNLKAAFSNEIYKLSKKKKIVVAAILSVAAVLVAALVVLGVNNFLGIRVMGNAVFPILVLSVLSYTLIPLFTAFVCIDMFSGEYVDQTMKMTLTQPVSRFKVFLSKVLAAAAFIFGNLVFVFVLTMIYSVATGTMTFSAGKVILAYLAAFLPLLVFSLFVIMISNITKGATSAFLISVLAFLVLIVGSIRFSGFQSFFFTSMFDWYQLFMGSYINLQKIGRVLLILLGCGTMLFAAGYYLFDKKDI